VKITDKTYAIDKPNKVKEFLEITYFIGCSSVDATIACMK
jgi:hypothetical protein